MHSLEEKLEIISSSPSEPYWASNAEFDNLAKKIQNDISSANLSALLFRNSEMLPLQKRELELLNDLRSEFLI